MTAGCKCRIPIMWPSSMAPKPARRSLPLHEPVYPLTAGLTNTTLRKAIGEALQHLPSLPEWTDAAFLAKQAWPSFAEALARLHAPEAEADLLPSAPARARLAYDELLANQLALAVIRARLKRRAGRRLAGTGRLRRRDPQRPALQADRRAEPRAGRDRRRSREPRNACCVSCKAMSAAARRLSRCSPWPPPSRPGRRPR